MLAGTWLPMKSLSRTLDPSTRIGRVGRLALRHSLFSRLQAGTIVSVARMTMERKPRVLAKVLYPPLNQPTANQKLQYLSFYFRVDDRRPDTAYTFTVPKGQDLMEALMSYASRMACHSSDEYVGAFQRHVKKLHAGEIPLPPLIQAQKSARDNATQDLKAPVPEILLPGKARDEEIERRLRQGQSFIDMGSSFQRTTMFIAREANRILGKYEVETLLRQKKRGQWSNDETQRLIALREQGLPLKTLTVWLRRTRPSIQKKLEELRSTLSGPGAVEGPQELPPGLQEFLFKTRLAAIWQTLLKSDMAQTWREALQEKPAEEWLSSVSMGIPEHIKKALGGLRPPTWVELESLPLIDTNDAGVYARLVTSRHQIQMVSDRYLYVGSASKYGGGLNWRIAQHIRKTKLKHESRLQYDIRTKRLKGNGRFVTLMVMKMDSSENEVVLHVRKTVILAEAILTVWLSALRSPSHDFQSVCPWDSQTLQYTGWASHNPLMDDVVLPGKHSQRQNQDRGH